MIDSVVVSFGFTLLVAGLVFVIRLFQPDFEIPDGSGVFYGIALVVWSFFYLWISYAVFGKTIGKMIVGVRVVSADGHAVLKGRQPFIRVLDLSDQLPHLRAGVARCGLQPAPPGVA